MDSMIGKNVIIRADKAGVFAGVLAHEDGTTVLLKQARRIWYWDGAASLSQLAIDGVSKPKTCKFPAPVEIQKIFGVIEIIPMTDAAVASVAKVKPWTV